MYFKSFHNQFKNPVSLENQKYNWGSKVTTFEIQTPSYFLLTIQYRGTNCTRIID